MDGQVLGATPVRIEHRSRPHPRLSRPELFVIVPASSSVAVQIHQTLPIVPLLVFAVRLSSSEVGLTGFCPGCPPVVPAFGRTL